MNVSRGFLLAIIAIVGAVSLLIVLPYLEYVLLALLLAYVLHPLHRRLSPRVGGTASAASMLALVTVAALLPFVVVLSVIASDVVAFAEDLQTGGIEFAAIESAIADLTGVQVDLASSLDGYGEQIGSALLDAASNAFGLLAHVIIGLGLTVFLLYYLLKDGERFIDWLREITPLPEPVQEDLYTEIDDVTWAVLVGHVFIAIVQGVVAGIGLIVTGVPSAVFWTVVMVILALLPVIGAFMVWGPAALWLAATGNLAAGVGLAIYGTIVVGVTDDYLRPIVVNRRADVSPAVIVLGVVGGLSLFGFIGLFVGPIVLGVLKASLIVFDDYYDRMQEDDSL
ncbi:Predicted PurR-regulated permease PerM [Natronoarchaeum philippinense]|uniref:Predicted PurR-regulated permease PerM n=1 Tax=Natronoarchaeum philippinense TaxID=558529 RepID=A0A285P6B7_NATPI|nr:AI-2E family transporter [Natronoarchaeum philippinense]SNZ17299.1 Predicted PurR-regulated permease PerM [Natronoarchaeum philippinense]